MDSVPTKQPISQSPSEPARRLFAGLAAALFDLDNTLIETHIDFPRMKREMLTLAERYGLDPVPLVARDILGVVEAAGRELESAGRAPEATRLRAEALARLAEIETVECASPVELKGAAEMLDLLRARGVPIAVVTRNCRAVSERLLAQGRLVCDALLTREDVARVKPHPDHLHAALAALARQRGVIALPPEASLMVGDHWMDVAAGQAAGMRTIGVCRNRPPDFFAEAMPDLLVNDMAELWALARDGA